jgi:hypothetical protein
MFIAVYTKARQSTPSQSITFRSVLILSWCLRLGPGKSTYKRTPVLNPSSGRLAQRHYTKNSLHKPGKCPPLDKEQQTHCTHLGIILYRHHTFSTKRTRNFNIWACMAPLSSSILPSFFSVYYPSLSFSAFNYFVLVSQFYLLPSFSPSVLSLHSYDLWKRYSISNRFPLIFTSSVCYSS